MTPRARTAAGTVRAGVCYHFGFYCDTPGPEIDAGDLLGYWTGEIDTWGKLTIFTMHGPPHYLFPREIVTLESAVQS